MVGHPLSLWAQTAVHQTEYPKLDHEIETECCIVGGGFCGLSTALHLGKQGVKSVLLEAEQPGWGASGRNGGQVIPGLKYDPDVLVARFGEKAGKALVEYIGNGPERLFSLIHEFRIDCDAMQTGWIQPAASEAGMATLSQRSLQWRREGAAVEMLDRDETERLLGSRHYIGAALDRRGGSVQPLSLARGLARAASDLGATIYGSSRALSISRTGERYRVETEQGAVIARSIVLATNAYTDRLWPQLEQTVVPVHSFQVATRPLPAEIARTILPEGHCASDTRRLLWYFRKDRTGRLLMGGRGRAIENPGESHTRILQAALRQVFPQIRDLEFEYFWGGKVAMTQDHLPHLHQLDENVFAGLGFNGRGVAFATAMGDLLARAVTQGSADGLPFPSSPLRPIKFHAFHPVAVQAMARYYRYLDKKENG